MRLALVLAASYARAQPADLEQLSRELTSVRADMEKTAANMQRVVEGVDAQLKQMQHEKKTLQHEQQQLYERVAQVEERERKLHDGAKRVQFHYAEQQEEKRRRTLDATAYSAAYIKHEGDRAKDFDGKLWQPLLDHVKRLTGLPADRVVEAQSGMKYPLVLLMVAVGSTRLDEVFKVDQSTQAQDKLLDGGKLVLVVVYKNEEKQGDTTPASVDAMVQFSASMQFGKPHELDTHKQMNQDGAEDLAKLVKTHVPQPPLLGADCLVSFLPNWMLSIIPGCQKLAVKSAPRHDEV